jgi:hypothetical protein
MASTDGEAEDDYEVVTYWRHLVHTYTGLSFIEIGNLNYVDFLQYRHDAFIQRCKETPSGREYLQDCKRMEQTKPDRGALRKYFGKGAPSGGQ